MPGSQQSIETPAFAEFASRMSFRPDPYQVEACAYLEQGAGVLVAAPTGAGKTVVGEFAVHLATLHGSKCFYTTPIKALSNQKFSDLSLVYGPDKVGLLTGDQVINSEADIAVMTTEVLRNMVYAGSPTLRGLEYVVLDEVHYLSDPFRGPVWEEIILSLESHVKIVGLSATVSNVEEFGSWLASVRADMRTVVSETRPVPLYQHVFASKRMYDMYEGKETTAGGTSTKVNPELLRMASMENHVMRDDSRRVRGSSGRGKRGSQADLGGRVSGRFASRSRLVPGRTAVIQELDRRGLLPAIYFIFSRQGCDQAASRLVDDGVWLTNAPQRMELEQIADRCTSVLSPDDLDALKYRDWREAYIRGIAAHHAGLLPIFKQAVEEGFSRGLIKVVFATETLALGINMPARTVVLDKLSKYNGIAHADISAGEYTQLTGRAGRRGIDVEGHAVVAWQAGLDPRALAGLASRRTYPLRSAFTPTYNMTVNLIASMGAERAKAILQDSFAQYHADHVRPHDHPKGRSQTLVRKFDSLCLVLEALGYIAHEGAFVDGPVNSDMDDWSAFVHVQESGPLVVTGSGRLLTRLYGSHDLLVAEAIRQGVFDSLSVPSLAATLSTLVYEARLMDKRAQHRMPDQPSAHAAEELRALWRQIRVLEKDFRLEPAPALDMGFARSAHAWASGSQLGDVVDLTGMAAGDFVRWIRQTIDCAGQIADAAQGTPLARTCRELVALMRRGVIDIDGD